MDLFGELRGAVKERREVTQQGTQGLQSDAEADAVSVTGAALRRACLAFQLLTFEVSPVPGPSSVAVCCIVGAAGGSRRPTVPAAPQRALVTFCSWGCPWGFAARNTSKFIGMTGGLNKPAVTFVPVRHRTNRSVVADAGCAALWAAASQQWR